MSFEDASRRATAKVFRRFGVPADVAQAGTALGRWLVIFDNTTETTGQFDAVRDPNPSVQLQLADVEKLADARSLVGARLTRDNGRVVVLARFIDQDEDVVRYSVEDPE